MAIVNLNTIKNWFKTGLKPTQSQFWSTWDSFWHKNDSIPANSIDGLDDLLDEKADSEAIENHLTDEDAHSDEFDKKVDKVEGKGLSSADFTQKEKTKLAELGTVSIKDSSSTEIFKVTDELSFGDGFELDPLEKKIRYSPTQSNWQTLPLLNGGTGYVKYKRIGNKILLRVSLSSYSESVSWNPFCHLAKLPIEFRPDEEQQRTVFGNTGRYGNGASTNYRNLALIIQTNGAVSVTFGETNQNYRFDSEFLINTNDL